MAAAMNEYNDRAFEPPSEWDHLPTLPELRAWMTFAPGVEYCWTLVKNLPRARRAGWSFVTLATPDGPLGQLSVMKIKDLDVILLCQGTPVPGMAPGSVPPEFRMDPELLETIESWAPKPAAVVSDPLPPPPDPNAVSAPKQPAKGYTPPNTKR